MKNVDNKEKRSNVLAFRLTNHEKQELDEFMKVLGFKTPSETIRYAIKEALNNV